MGRSRPAAAALLARRVADNIEVAALPAAADWPNLERLCVPLTAALPRPGRVRTRRAPLGTYLCILVCICVDAAVHAYVYTGSECTGVSISCVRVCVRAWRLSMDSARSTARLPDAARWARPHARAVCGRSIHSTKVKALPESLGNWKLLETLCVPPATATVRVRCGAGAAL